VVKVPVHNVAEKITATFTIITASAGTRVIAG
jgi:hypothetical protein